MTYIEITPSDAAKPRSDQATSDLAGPSQGPAISSTDGELLMRFTRHGDQDAFAQLVDTHGALVWSVCRQVLRREVDVEDAFQATFLVLARRASDIRASDSAAGWLYRVAHRVSLSLYRKNKTRTEEPLNGHDFASPSENPLEQLHRRHSVTVLVEELRMLPARYQQPLILCYLEGHTRAAAADLLDLTAATIKGRVARGKRMLRHRLARRGVALSAAFGVASIAAKSAEATVAGLSLAPSTTAAATNYLSSGPAAAQHASPAAVSLAHQGASTMFYAALAKPAISIAAVLALGVGAALVANEPPAPPSAAGGPGISLLSTSNGDADDRATEVEIAAPQPAASTGDLLSEVEPASRQPSGAKPTASTTGLAPDRVNVEFATTDNDEDILVLRGEQPAVARTQQRMMQMFGQQQRSPGINYTAPGPLSPVDTPSVEELEMQLKYWERRAQGLKKMADAKRSGAMRLRQAFKSGDVAGASAAEADEMVAEATLLDADVFQAKAKMLEMQRRIEKQRQPQQVLPSYAPQPTAPSAPQSGHYGPAPQPLRVQPPAIATPQSAAGTLSIQPPSGFRDAPELPQIVPPTPAQPYAGFTAPTPAETDLPTPNPDFFLPGETVVVSITRKAPREMGTAYVLRINENGMINVPGTNRVAKIAGKKSEAAGKILAELRQHHQGYADVMGMEVEVTRINGSIRYPTLSSPPVGNSARYVQPETSQLDPGPVPANDASELEELHKQMDKLRRHNEKLQQQLEAADNESDPLRDQNVQEQEEAPQNSPAARR